ncbi:MAG: hypothetical protein LQ340_001204 [Diploschistes diacapsis]|nr:MAG: hypothetical protein LQ340_001204 [Diploschistes diacapsis]
MDERAAIPPGLPKPNPTTSYWQDPPADIASHRSSHALPASASVVIIGSGITGSSLAYHLLSQSSASNIVLLEARTACSGATGRNGGHTKCASYRSFLSNVETHGVQEAVRIAKFEYNTMRAVHDFAREHAIDCDSWQGDSVDVIYDEDEWRLANDAVARLQEALGPDEPAARYILWNAGQVEERFLTPNTLGAVSYEAGSLSAYKFVVGVLKLALNKGLNLQTGTPATSIRRADSGWLVKTPRGDIAAEKVVLATNGYTAHLYPAFQGVIVPLRGHVVAQRPGLGLPKPSLGSTYSFIYRGSYEYMIPRPPGSKYAGDIVIGGGSTVKANLGMDEFGCTDDDVVDTIVSTYLGSCTKEYFSHHWGEDDPDGRVRRTWSGIMGYSSDGFPFVGEMDLGLFVAASFQGHGMVLCFLCTKALSITMNREEDDTLQQWFPKAFRFSQERLMKRIQGRLHAVLPKGAEDKSVE